MNRSVTFKGADREATETISRRCREKSTSLGSYLNHRELLITATESLVSLNSSFNSDKPGRDAKIRRLPLETGKILSESPRLQIT